MISLKIKKPKIHFFGRQVIRSNWKKLATHPLSRIGNIIKSNARSKIGRLTKKATTPPRPAGSPPRMRSPKKEFKLIFSIPQDLSSVIVGMVGFGGSTPIPGLQEHGGTVQRTVSVLGGSKHKHTRKTSGKYAKRLQTKKFRTVGGRVTATPIRKRAMVKLPPRPFMAPAFERAKPKIPPIWKGSLNKA